MISEFWKYDCDYKFYCEDMEVFKKLLSLKGSIPAAIYLDSNLKLVGKDAIVSANRLKIAKKISSATKID